MIIVFQSLDSFRNEIIINKPVLFYKINYAKHYTQHDKG
jgi:hypothetical protein